ncbi:MAG: hypothetical protein OSB10_05030 [Planctomycetota bacterium]|nr:hypothetical protein [Planctomycetota bacterium]
MFSVSADEGIPNGHMSLAMAFELLHGRLEAALQSPAGNAHGFSLMIPSVVMNSAAFIILFMPLGLRTGGAITSR